MTPPPEQPSTGAEMHKPRMDLPFGKCSGLLAGRHLEQRKRDIGVRIVELLDRRAENRMYERQGAVADVETACLAFAHPLGHYERLAEVLHDRLKLWKQRAPRSGQLDPVSEPLEKRCSKL